jgi:hypothetical protein
MTTTNPEANGGQPVLRREAHKALNGRVPLGLAIALAALSGMLFGYGVRSFVAERSCPRHHHIMIVREKVRRPLQMPASEGCRGALRLQLLQHPGPDGQVAPDPARLAATPHNH